MKMAEYLKAPELYKILMKVYLARSKEFARISFHLIIEDCNNLLRKMCNSEIELFNIGRKAAIAFRGWK